MAAKRKKLILLTSILSAFSVAIVALVAGGKALSSPIGVGGSTELVNGTITWTASNSEKTTHAGNRVSYLRNTARKTPIYAYAYGQYDASDSCMLDSKGSDYQTFGIFISSVAGTSSSLFQFQNITSISVVTDSGSDSGATFKVYTNSTSDGSAAYTGTSDGSEQTFNISSEVSGAKYLAVRPANNLEIQIKSITVNYTCEPGGVEPSPDVYNISYYGFDGDDKEELYGIDESSLVKSAEEGESVEIEVEALSGYSFYFAFEYTDVLTDWSLSGSTISFTMPASNVEICIQVETEEVVLSSITISSYTTEYEVNDLFEFDGVVTAHYSDGSDDVVEPTNVTEPDMTSSGTKEITVSYTEGGVTKTASYNISVTGGTSAVVLTGTYRFSSRSVNTSGKKWDGTDGTMTITFSNDGTLVWRNERIDTYSRAVDAKVLLDYTATDNGAYIEVSMELTGIDFTVGGATNTSAMTFSGAYTDRPCIGFGVGAKNETGNVSSDRSSLTISVYDGSSSPYKYYDTFTFSLVS